jgi:hypothetical protein
MSQPQKKCPHCQQWSTWNQNIEDTCQYCGASLSPREVEEQLTEQNKDTSDQFKIKLIRINEHDHPVLKIFKRFIQGFQLLFFSIVSFTVWLATAIAG